jgi:DNA invertase Pin-like site-specific DNA recombinase
MWFLLHTGCNTKKERVMVETQTFAYLRVSKLDQDLEKNKMDILKLANNEHLGHVHFVEEKVSGKISWRRRQIADILEKTQPGDTIIVSELSRLGRSMQLRGKLVSTLAKFNSSMAITISRSNPLTFTSSGGSTSMLG